MKTKIKFTIVSILVLVCSLAVYVDADDIKDEREKGKENSILISTDTKQSTNSIQNTEVYTTVIDVQTSDQVTQSSTEEVASLEGENDLVNDADTKVAYLENKLGFEFSGLIKLISYSSEIEKTDPGELEHEVLRAKISMSMNEYENVITKLNDYHSEEKSYWGMYHFEGLYKDTIISEYQRQDLKNTPIANMVVGSTILTVLTFSTGENGYVQMYCFYYE